MNAISILIIAAIAEFTALALVAQQLRYETKIEKRSAR